MLQLLLGPAGSGKTWRLVDEIRSRAENGRFSVLIVPEQFSSTAELTLYEKLGDRLCAQVGVYSFRSLGEKIESVYGGGARKTVTDAGRVVLARRAATHAADKLTLYRGHRRSTAFCQMCAAAIRELKTAGASPGDLLALEAPRLQELGIIFDAYETLLAGTGLDPTDRIALAADRAGAGFLRPAWFFVDDFDGFTAPEYVLLRRLMRDGEGCSVALCTDSLTDRQNGTGLFSPVQRTARRLLRLAAADGVQVKKPVYLMGNRRAATENLRFIERFLREGVEKAPPSDGSVFAGCASDRYEEVRYAAARLYELLKQGEDPARLALVCREVGQYREEIERQFPLWGLPYFIDEAGTAELTAPAVFLRAALGMLKEGVNTRRVLQLLKSGLCGVEETLLGELENYAYIWQLKAEEWRRPFTKNPAGLEARGTEEEIQRLARLEKLRAALMEKLEDFSQKAKGVTGRVLSQRLYWLLDAFGAPEAALQAAALFRGQGNEAEADETLRLWDVTIGLLDEMADLLGDEAADAAEYDELFLLLLRSAEVGRLPRTPHQIIVTGADRMRLDEPRHIVIVGINEDVFPAQVGYSGLLTHADRELLVEKGIEMPGAFENRVLLEEMYFYRALTAPSHSLTLLWHATEEGGAAQLSPALAALYSVLRPKILEFSAAQLAATPLAAADLLAGRYHQSDAETAALREALEEQPDYRPLLERMRKAKEGDGPQLRYPAELRRLLGGTMELSPTRVERFYACRYSYFLEYVLRVKPLRKAELDVMQSGTFVHYLLEQALRACGEEFLEKTQEELCTVCGVLAQRYMDERLPDAVQSPRFLRLLARLTDNVARLLLFIQEEQKQGLFRPVAYELPIGRDGAPALTLKGEEGEEIRIIGTVDRADVYRRDGVAYLRVVDYKTGRKEFHLDEIYNGLNTQMLLYLAALEQNGLPGVEDPRAAGVLYLMSDPAPKTVTRAQASAAAPAYTVDGLILEDTDIIDAMDGGHTGRFVPLSFTKNSYRATEKAADLAKLGRITAHVKKLAAEMGDELYRGEIAASPLVHRNKKQCDYCDYRCVCRHEDGRGEVQLSAPEHLFCEEESE